MGCREDDPSDVVIAGFGRGVGPRTLEAFVYVDSPVIIVVVIVIAVIAAIAILVIFVAVAMISSPHGVEPGPGGGGVSGHVHRRVQAKSGDARVLWAGEEER